MPFFLILSQFVCVLESVPKSPAAHQLLTVTCFQVFTFSSFLPHEMRVVFVFPLSLTLRSGLKPKVVSVLFFLFPGLFWASYIPVPRAELFVSFYLQGQSQISLQSFFVFPLPSTMGARKGLVSTICWGQQWFPELLTWESGSSVRVKIQW